MSVIFVAVSLLGILAGNKAIIAQIRNIYGNNSDQIMGLNSLMSAVANNDVGGVRFFAKGGPALVNQQNIGGATALHIASREGNYEIVEILIANGADVNLSDSEGWTPLMRAALFGADDIVELLLAKNADATKLNSVNESAIIQAANSDCTQCLNLMFDKFNFIKLMDGDALKSQLNDAYVIAEHHENSIMRGVLEKYLDQVVKMEKLLPDTSEIVSEDLVDISISQGSRFELVTQNKGDKVLPLNNDRLHRKIKNHFKFITGKMGVEEEGEEESSATMQSEDGVKYNLVKKKEKISVITPEAAKKKFIFITGAAAKKNNTIAEEENQPVKKFRPNDSNDVFLKNSKVGDKPVVEVLKSKKFRFSRGPIGESKMEDKDVKYVIQNQPANTDNVSSPEKSPTESVSTPNITTTPSSSQSNDLIEPIPEFNSFKLLTGPKS